MIRLFTENRMLAVVLMPFFVVGYVLLNHYLNHFTVTDQLDFGLFGTHGMSNLLAKQIAGAFIVFFNAIGLNVIFNNHNFYEKTTYLPAFLYIVWMSFFSEMYNPDGKLLSHSVCILMIAQLFKLNQNEDGRKVVFNAAFLVGVATCLHVSLVLLLPFTFFMVWIIRPFVVRESILLLAGFVVPLLYAGVYLLFQGETSHFDWKIQEYNMRENQLFTFIVVAFVLLFVAMSIFGVRAKLKKSSIRFRKLTRILWLFLFLTLCVGFVDVLLTQELDGFSYLFIVLPFFFFFSFVKKSLAFIANSLFVIVLIFSFLKFFL